MSDQPPRKPRSTTARDERLRAALRANLQRRKAQARARAEQPDRDQDADEGTTGKDDS